MSVDASAQVVVVGGGIGGFSTALALARKGITVQVLERHPEIKEIGAGLQLGPNAGKVMERMGVLDPVLRTAVIPERFVISDVITGRELYAAELGDKLRDRFGAPYTVMHRGDLLADLIREALGTGLVEATPGKEVVSVSQDDRTATVSCADGSSYTADTVVGADGLRSVIRRLVLDPAAPLRSPYVIYRGPGPRPEGTEDSVKLYTGDRIHLMEYPIQGGNMLNRVLSFRSDRGEPGSDTWGTLDEMEERFAGACDHVRAAMEALDRTKRWDQFDRAPLAGWSQGRVTLLGDAAHAMRQYLAQGAGQAMEDAIVLADVLAAGLDDVPAALQEYEARRFPKASAVQRNTRFFGEFVHMGGAGAVVRDEYLRNLPADAYHFVEWLYGDCAAPVPQPPAHLDFYSVGS